MQPTKIKLVSIADAAQALMRHRSTIARWCETGYLKAEKRKGPGSSQPWLIPLSEIRRLGGEP